MAEKNSNGWSWEQNKAFENALATHLDDGSVNRWERIADQVPGKSVEDVIQHFQQLERDVVEIDSGRVPLPNYSNKDEQVVDGHARTKFGAEKERGKGKPWSEDEHRLFLLGLQTCGKSDWKRISREFVISRTPQQIASHAQKYYNRQRAGTKDRKRSSIHDINTLDHLKGQGPITGEENQSENIYLDYQRENVYAGNQMESGYPDLVRHVYTPIAVDNVFYLENQTNDVENQNLKEDIYHQKDQTINATEYHPKDHKHR